MHDYHSARNLNEIPIDVVDPTPESFGQRDSKIQISSSIDIHFKDLEQKLVAEIKRWPVIVGCMAWLSNEAVLSALSTRQAVSILIQKEDFLRPDTGNWSALKLRKLYAVVPGYNVYASGASYNFACDPDREAIRCVGICEAKTQITPRMHHKFLVFCATEAGEYRDMYVPKAVWTGSFNATKNGTRSLENAVVLRNAEAAGVFYQEWMHVLGLSEPLDWESAYVCPEYRWGT